MSAPSGSDIYQNYLNRLAKHASGPCSAKGRGLVCNRRMKGLPDSQGEAYALAKSRVMTELFFLLLLLTGAGFGSFGQTLSTLYSFGTLTNEAGVMPEAQLTEGSDRMLYGTTSEGGGGRGLNQNAALAGPVFQGKGGLLQ